MICGLFYGHARRRYFIQTSLQFLEGLLNEKLLPLILKAAAIDENLSVQQLGEAQIGRLCERLKHFRMSVNAVNDFDSHRFVQAA